jgi:hypothetical protein
MGPLVIILKGNIMTAKPYLETIKKHFIPFYCQMQKKYGLSIIMQENNAPWHTVTIVKNYLSRQKVKTLY